MIKQKKIFPMNNMDDSHTTLSLLLLLLVPTSKVSKYIFRASPGFVPGTYSDHGIHPI